MHDRMPVILSEERALKWIDCANVPWSECVKFLSPYKASVGAAVLLVV